MLLVLVLLLVLLLLLLLSSASTKRNLEDRLNDSSGVRTCYRPSTPRHVFCMCSRFSRLECQFGLGLARAI